MLVVAQLTCVNVDEIHNDEFIFDHFDTVIAKITQESDDYALIVSHYAVLRSNNYLRWGRVEDFEVAIERARAVVAATASNYPYRAGWLHNLGILYSCHIIPFSHQQ